MSLSVYREIELPGTRVGTLASGAEGAERQGSLQGTRRLSTTRITDLPALEEAVAGGVLREWRRLAEDAPHASLFQSPGWCMPWYRAYAASYSPFVVVATVDQRLVGLVPMAVDRSTGAFVFASNTAADYRDIVALPEYRLQVLDALLDAYLAGRYPNPLQIGWLDPTSDTAALVETLCRQRRLRFVIGQQPCYRWYPPAPAKPSAQKFLNWYKRKGTVSFDVVTTDEEWRTFSQIFYRQHSLRQLQAGRRPVFDNPQRLAFYAALFHSTETRCHVSKFSVDGTMLAGHFGYVWRDVLLLGPPSIRLQDEQRSPAVILLSWIIQNAEKLGLRGFDLTIGDSDFKKRLGNQCVTLTTIDIYPTRFGYARRLVRGWIAGAMKQLVRRAAGPDAWQDRMKPFFDRLTYKKARIAEEGVAATLRAALLATLRAVGEYRRGHVYAVTPGEVKPVSARLAGGETLEFHENVVEDLLLWQGNSLTTAAAISECARSFSRVLHANGTLHTVLIGGRLAGWGFSYYPSAPAQLTETPGASLTFPAGAVALYDFHVIPQFRGRRVYQSLLTRILQQRFGEGATSAWITVLESNTPSRVAIERVGFQLVSVNYYSRLLKWQRLRQRPHERRG